MTALRFAWITDVPTPYRVHSFERMAQLLPEFDIEFSVHFMAWHSRHRPWRYGPEDVTFRSTVHRGMHPSLRGHVLHINPGLVTTLRRADIDVAMVGGYGSPSHVAAPFALRPNVVKILGCESTLESVSKTDGVAGRLRSTVISQYDGFLVPQRRSLDLLARYDEDVSAKPHIVFPNVVSESLFGARVRDLRARRAGLRAQWNLPRGDVIWFCPARLAPEKGLLEFLDAFVGTEGVRLVVAGDGPLRAQIESLAVASDMPVTLLGQRSEDEIAELYALSDVFVLPSLRDPSPVSSIEACAAGLPLLVSSRIGPAEEVLARDNGWSFDITSHAATRRAIQRASRATPEELETKGARSARLHSEQFETDACISRLAEDVRAIWSASGKRRGLTRSAEGSA